MNSPTGAATAMSRLTMAKAEPKLVQSIAKKEVLKSVGDKPSR